MGIRKVLIQPYKQDETIWVVLQMFPHQAGDQIILPSCLGTRQWESGNNYEFEYAVPGHPDEKDISTIMSFSQNIYD